MTPVARRAMLAAGVALSVASLSGCALVNLAGNTLHAQTVAAANSKLESELLDAGIAMVSYGVQSNGSYSGATPAVLETNGLRADEVPEKFKIVISSGGFGFCLQGTTKFGETAHVDESATFATGPCR